MGRHRAFHSKKPDGEIPRYHKADAEEMLNFFKSIGEFDPQWRRRKLPWKCGEGFIGFTLEFDPR